MWEELVKPQPEYHTVDLGLPSGKLWADRNVGALSIQDYGDYFMWGSTTPNTDTQCDWAHYQFNNGKDYFDYSYFNANSGTWLDTNNGGYSGFLRPEYDAARVNMGDGWRIGTDNDFRELQSNTTQESGIIEGVSGMYFISKADETKKIFIPFAGSRRGSEFKEVGERGYLFGILYRPNSTYEPEYTDETVLRPDSVSYDYSTNYLCNGCSVRGVRDAE